MSITDINRNLLVRLRQKVLTYVEYRAVSGVFRTIDRPPPLQPASVSSPRRGVHTRRAVRGSTTDTGLVASYSILPLRAQERGEEVDRETTQARHDGDRRNFIIEERRQDKTFKEEKDRRTIELRRW